LAELKKAAQQSLEWLWEWYWSQLDVAFSRAGARPDAPSSQDVKEQLQGYLKAYVRSRKAELKGGVKAASKESKAAETASNSVLSLGSVVPAYHNLLLGLLVDDLQIVPSDRRIGDTMSGAFLIWGPFLIKLSTYAPTFPELLLDRMMSLRNGRAGEPVREAMFKWLLQILTSDEWKGARKSKKLVEHVLERCFISPTGWNIQLAEALLQNEEVPNHEHWNLLLSAAKDEDMDIDPAEQTTVEGEKDTEVKMIEEEDVEKTSGPQKWVGMWRPTPIGALPVGWEDAD
jgi:ribosomal biogenesis protein LAS1